MTQASIRSLKKLSRKAHNSSLKEANISTAKILTSMGKTMSTFMPPILRYTNRPTIQIFCRALFLCFRLRKLDGKPTAQLLQMEVFPFGRVGFGQYCSVYNPNTCHKHICNKSTSQSQQSCIKTWIRSELKQSWTVCPTTFLQNFDKGVQRHPKQFMNSLFLKSDFLKKMNQIHRCSGW